jgi:DNA polymerase III subunit epsilon
MLYAVVDIETTGSHASGNGITEIAIAIHDGQKTIDFYETLVNPNAPIPYFIQRLTGINDAMVAKAPQFYEVAPVIYRMLHDKVFVAHNVNFDYSFVKHQLLQSGYDLETKKLCTVRLARKVLPGLTGYSLGKLCTQLQINLVNHHRAGGDALATADLLSIIVARDTQNVIQAMLKGRNREQYIPPHLPVEHIDRLPSTPGVYYFYNAAGKPVYVGKAKNIHKRVKSHFSNNKIHKQKQDFLKDVHRITYKECATELMAHILESTEIRRLWPIYNRSQRGYLPRFALFQYEDGAGYQRLVIEKQRHTWKPIYSFNTLTEGYDWIKQLIDRFALCPVLCNIATECDCDTHERAEQYNERMVKALTWMEQQLPTFALVDVGLEDNEHSCILMKNGNLYGMGYINDKGVLKNMHTLEKQLEPLQTNDYIRNLIYKHALDYPEKCVAL